MRKVNRQQETLFGRKENMRPAQSLTLLRGLC